MKLVLLATTLTTLSTPNAAFIPQTTTFQKSYVQASTVPEVDTRTGKPTGNSFLPSDAIERATTKGNPTEKAKQRKDGTSAWSDVYELAAKVREGSLEWKEIEKDDFDTVRYYVNINPAKLMIHRGLNGQDYSTVPNAHQANSCSVFVHLTE